MSELDPSEWPAPEEYADEFVVAYRSYGAPDGALLDAIVDLRIEAEEKRYRFSEMSVDLDVMRDSPGGEVPSAMTADCTVMYEHVLAMSHWFDELGDYLADLQTEVRREVEAAQEDEGDE